MNDAITIFQQNVGRGEVASDLLHNHTRYINADSMKCLQINLNRSTMELQLMYATAAEADIDVLIVSEPPRSATTATRWNSSLDNSCAIIVTSSANLVPSSTGSGQGYAWAIIGSVLMVSCYCTPNCSPFEFFAFLDEVERAIREVSGPSNGIVLAGDFNAKSPEWGSTMLDYKGQALGALIGSLGLSVENIGTMPTFSRRNQSSIIDVTFSTRVRISGWRVDADTESLSDHRYIYFDVNSALDCLSIGRSESNNQRNCIRGWSFRKVNEGRLIDSINENVHLIEGQIVNGTSASVGAL